MSNIAIKGAATGSGTFTLEAPATSTNRTLTLPDEAGTILTTATAGVPVNGPAFSAYGSATQSLGTSVTTKVILNTEEFDTNSDFDSATNYRFTPTVAGYYQLTSTMFFAGGGAGGVGALYIYKNGVLFKQISSPFISGSNLFPILSSLVYANGSTDYFEVYLYQNSGTTRACGSNSASFFFAGCLVRSAT